MKPDVLILAGSRPGGDRLAQAEGVAHKAQLMIAGEPMLAHVIRTVQASPELGRIFVALPEDIPLSELLPPTLQLDNSRLITVAAHPAGPSHTVAEVLAQRAPDAGLLVTTGDHPLLSTAMIAEMLFSCEEMGADVGAALVPLGLVERAYPQAQRTGLRLGGERFSGANLFWLNGYQALPAVRYWQELEAMRKQPWRMAWRIGPRTLLRYLTGRLRVEALFAIFSNRLRLHMVPVVLSQPEAAIDVDKPADLQLVRQIMVKAA